MQLKRARPLQTMAERWRMLEPAVEPIGKPGSLDRFSAYLARVAVPAAV
jgi:hypothetical protein